MPSPIVRALADRRRRRRGRRCRRAPRRPRRRRAGRGRRRGSAGRRDRTASTSLAISDSDTIDVSSTTTTSCGSRLLRSWRKRLRLPGRQPSSRCRVDARRSEQPLPGRGADRHRAPRFAVHRLLSRAAALPGRGGEGDTGRRLPAAAGLLVEQGEDAGDGRRLAGAGPAGDDCEAAVTHRRRRRRRWRSGVVCRRTAVERRARAQPASTPGAGARLRASRSAAMRRSSPPVAVEVERVPSSRSGRSSGRAVADRDQRAGGEPCDPVRRRRATAAPAGRPRSSRSLVAVGARSSARSTQTEPSRGARTASAAAEERRARRPRRPAARAGARTWTSAATSTPASLNARSRPVARRASRRRPRRRSTTSSAVMPPPAPVEQVAQGHDERRRRPPREDAAGLRRRPAACRRRSSPAGTGRARRPRCRSGS